ncbi:hypothetical protein BOTBODRAFT_599907 [Botryobasidium botryosum FD-172 SS1]|uniref:Uncharacterized protein n=1 Tax=Botryobasidium botryosum (strain FD-172 SS1) TaxID=930990 RepID=A0A067MNP7_BOTB1|nr:hypothetical protein BOTBODRAFT_599907 [Botryobasidium botryosum FD-172 SS1]
MVGVLKRPKHQPPPHHQAAMSLACIIPNPDIAGIGVRASIYAQNLLAFVPAILFLSDRELTIEELESMGTISTSILITACALLVSAFIQAATFGLSVYHALIVLNLSWINNMNAVVYCLFALETRAGGSPPWKWKLRNIHFRELVSSGIVVVIGLAIVHLSAMAGLGIWIWGRVDEFGDQRQCTPYTLYVLFGKSVSVVDKSLRIGSLVLYSITAIPFVNLFLFFLLGWATSYIPLCVIIFLCLPQILWKALVCLFMCWLGCVPCVNLYIPTGRVKYYSTLLFSLIIEIIFIVDTELMIRRSADLVQEGGSEWTFGQTLAMLLLVLPLIDVVKESCKWLGFDPTAGNPMGGLTNDVEKALKRWGGKGSGEQWDAVVQSLIDWRTKVDASESTEPGKDIKTAP